MASEEDFVHCICCEDALDVIDYLHPKCGTYFVTYGNYGSTVFDPIDGSTMTIFVCNTCLEKKKWAAHILPQNAKGAHE